MSEIFTSNFLIFSFYKLIQGTNDLAHIVLSSGGQIFIPDIKMTIKLHNLASAAIGLAAIPAIAAPVLVTETLSLNELLSGNATSIQFNVASLLASQGLTPAGIQSGTLVVYGLSDPNFGAAASQPYGAYQVDGPAGSHTASYTYYVGGSYSCGWWSTCYYSYPVTGYYSVTDYSETRSRDVLHVDNVADQMNVSVGSSSASDTASQILNITDAYKPSTYDGSVGGGANPIYYQYSRERDVYEAVYGTLQSSLALDSVAIQDIAADGILNALVSAPVGQFNLLTAELSVWADAVQTNSSVPEPGSLALAGLALAAGSATRIRYKKKS